MYVSKYGFSCDWFSLGYDFGCAMWQLSCIIPQQRWWRVMKPFLASELMTNYNILLEGNSSLLLYNLAKLNCFIKRLALLCFY